MKRRSESQDSYASIKQMRNRPLESYPQPADRRVQVRTASADQWFICDFVCRELGLIVEVDGGQHNESESDAVRDRRLTEQGYKAVRFWNNDVLGNIEGVITVLQGKLSDRAARSS